MKTFKILIAFAVMAAVLLACTPQEGGENMNAVKMTAKITAIGERIEVEVIDGEYGASGPFWVITNTGTVYLDKDGNRTMRLALHVGDTVEISYSGQMMLSYPPQVVAFSIQVK